MTDNDHADHWEKDLKFDIMLFGVAAGDALA